MLLWSTTSKFQDKTVRVHRELEEDWRRFLKSFSSRPSTIQTGSMNLDTSPPRDPKGGQKEIKVFGASDLHLQAEEVASPGRISVWKRYPFLKWVKGQKFWKESQMRLPSRFSIS
jgi:hypothetical protein